eukprot:CCRYP_003096-RA/>CCRYP_003096-RA protein AED:0.35 eAED:0.35 QI:215/1/1/1/0/0/2/117/94
MVDVVFSTRAALLERERRRRKLGSPKGTLPSNLFLGAETSRALPQVSTNTSKSRRGNESCTGGMGTCILFPVTVKRSSRFLVLLPENSELMSVR